MRHSGWGREPEGGFPDGPQTCLLRPSPGPRPCDDTYTESYIKTIGVDFKIRTIGAGRQNHSSFRRSVAAPRAPVQRYPSSQGEGPWAWSPGLTCPFSDCLVVGHSWSGTARTITSSYYRGSRIIVVYDATDQVVLGSLSPLFLLSLRLRLCFFTVPILSSSCCPERRLSPDLFHKEAKELQKWILPRQALL